jgi:hypothetical protein
MAALQGELRDRNVFHFQAANVKELRLSGWKQVYGSTADLVLERQADKTWKVKQAPFTDLQVDPHKVDFFLQDLTDPAAPLVERFLEGGVKPAYKLDQADRSLEIVLTADGQKTSLTIGALDAAQKAYDAQSSAVPNEVFLVAQHRIQPVLSAGLKYFTEKGK